MSSMDHLTTLTPTDYPTNTLSTLKRTFNITDETLILLGAFTLLATTTRSLTKAIRTLSTLRHPRTPIPRVVTRMLAAKKHNNYAASARYADFQGEKVEQGRVGELLEACREMGGKVFNKNRVKATKEMGKYWDI